MGGDGLKMKPSVLMVIVTRYSCTNESQERVKRAQRGAEDDPKPERNTDSRRCLCYRDNNRTSAPGRDWVEHEENEPRTTTSGEDRSK